MLKQQSEAAAADQPMAAGFIPGTVTSIAAVIAERVTYVDMVCPHNREVYPCYDWMVDSLIAQGWTVQEG